MWKNILKMDVKKAAAVLAAHILIVVLCGCSGNEELLPLEQSGQSLEEAVLEASGVGLEAAHAGEPESTGTLKGEGVGQGTRKTLIYVHVCGAVVNPGVVEVPEGSRAQAAVEAAGGFTEEADTAYVNLAAPVADGEQLYVPTKEEAGSLRSDQAAVQSGLVNLNTADVSELCTLPGIGESRAGDIIIYRQENGRFTDIEEIMKVSGIKANTYEKIKDLITVN